MEQVQEFMQQMLEGTTVSRESAAQIAERTGGLPLYVEQVRLQAGCRMGPPASVLQALLGLQAQQHWAREYDSESSCSSKQWRCWIILCCQSKPFLLHSCLTAL